MAFGDIATIALTDVPSLLVKLSSDVAALKLQHESDKQHYTASINELETRVHAAEKELEETKSRCHVLEQLLFYPARDRALGICEIREGVLGHLDFHDLFKASQVSKSFRELITSSKPLKQKLLLEVPTFQEVTEPTIAIPLPFLRYDPWPGDWLSQLCWKDDYSFMNTSQNGTGLFKLYIPDRSTFPYQHSKMGTMIGKMFPVSLMSVQNELRVSWDTPVWSRKKDDDMFYRGLARVTVIVWMNKASLGQFISAASHLVASDMWTGGEWELTEGFSRYSSPGVMPFSDYGEEDGVWLMTSDPEYIIARPWTWTTVTAGPSAWDQKAVLPAPLA